MNDTEKKLIKPKEYHEDLIKSGKRADGRSLDQARDVKVKVNAIRTATSSSIVKIGHTSVVCGCIPQIITVDTNESIEPIKLKVELPPICMNPTGFKTHHTEPILTRTIYSILQDSGIIKPEEFLIGNGDKYWRIEIEVICLNYDGCLIDAALIAIISSLQTMKLSGTDEDISESRIRLHSIPLSITFATIDDLIICDPTFEEEFAAQSTFSITIDAQNGRLCHINKTGGRSISPLSLSECIDRAKKQSERLEQLKQFDSN